MFAKVFMKNQNFIENLTAKLCKFSPGNSTNFKEILKQKPFPFVFPPVLGTPTVLYYTADWKMGGTNNVID